MNRGPEFRLQIVRLIRAREHLTVTELARGLEESVAHVQYALNSLRGAGVPAAIPARRDAYYTQARRLHWKRIMRGLNAG